MNKILAFDTSNHHCSVAISIDKKLVFYRKDPRPSMQAETLLPMIEQGLNASSLKYKGLDYLAVTTGPGSFTGIRIGLATAKAIIRAADIKPIGIDAFTVGQYRIKQQLQNCRYHIILIDALRGQQYVKYFENQFHSDASLVQENTAIEPQLLDNVKAVDLIIDLSAKGDVACAGSGVHSLYRELKLLPNVMLLPRFSRIDASYLCRIAELYICNKNFDATLLAPIYVRPPDAKKSLK